MRRSTQFDEGDVVLDREAEEQEPMYVLDPARGRADEVYIPELESTVAEVNSAYPPNDPVIECIHESWLEHNAGERWRSWPQDEFADRLRDFAAEWSLSVRTYDYPESRLTLVADEGNVSEPDDGQPDQPQGQTSMDDWAGS